MSNITKSNHYIVDLEPPDVKILQYNYFHGVTCWNHNHLSSPFWYLWHNDEAGTYVIYEKRKIELKPDMTLLEKIVFTADYIEPGRDQALNLAWLRQLAFTDIDQAVCEILKQTLDYLRDQGGEIDPATEVTYSYYLQKCAEDAES